MLSGLAVATTVALAEPAGRCNHSSAPSLHGQHLGVCRCACTFVDIGLNDGRTLLHWWRHPSLAASLPAAQLQRLQACAALPHKSHCYYGIEANARWSERLLEQQRRLRARGLRVKLFTDTALSTKEGVHEFFVERSGPGLDASLEATREEHYKDSRGWHRNPQTSLRESKAFRAERVRTMDAAPFFAQLAHASDFVAVKLDIEVQCCLAARGAAQPVASPRS